MCDSLGSRELCFRLWEANYPLWILKNKQIIVKQNVCCPWLWTRILTEQSSHHGASARLRAGLSKFNSSDRNSNQLFRQETIPQSDGGRISRGSRVVCWRIRILATFPGELLAGVFHAGPAVSDRHAFAIHNQPSDRPSSDLGNSVVGETDSGVSLIWRLLRGFKKGLWNNPGAAPTPSVL